MPSVKIFPSGTLSMTSGPNAGSILESVWVVPFFGDILQLANNGGSREIVFLDSMGTQHSYLPGRILLPPVTFNLDPRIMSVEVDLTLTFDMQLEGGDSNLSFGEIPDWPSNVVQIPQWKLDLV